MNHGSWWTSTVSQNHKVWQIWSHTNLQLALQDCNDLRADNHTVCKLKTTPMHDDDDHKFWMRSTWMTNPKSEKKRKTVQLQSQRTWQIFKTPCVNCTTGKNPWLSEGQILQNHDSNSVHSIERTFHGKMKQCAEPPHETSIEAVKKERLQWWKQKWKAFSHWLSVSTFSLHGAKMAWMDKHNEFHAVSKIVFEADMHSCHHC